MSCIDPISIRGPVRWQSSNVSLVRVPIAEGDEGFAVRDELIGLEITCGAVEVKENVRLP